MSQDYSYDLRNIDARLANIDRSLAAIAKQLTIANKNTVNIEEKEDLSKIANAINDLSKNLKK